MKTAKEKATKGESLKIKEPTDKGFSIIYNPLKSDYSLNRNERAILWTLICASPTFKPSINGISKLLKIGKSTTIKEIKSLQKRGYLIIDKKETKGATWSLNFEPQTPLFEMLEENAKNGILNLQQLNALTKAHKITRAQAQKIISIAREILIKQSEDD